MSGKKAGSDGQIRKTTSEWSADTKTYPEGMRLMDTDTGYFKLSKGTTYALAWGPFQHDASGGSTTPADLPYTYTNATSGDPTSGKIGFNTTTPASINSVRIHFTDGNGVSQSGLVSQLNTTGGTMLFRWSGGSLVLRIGSSSGSFGSWASYDATYVSGTLPADGTAMSVDVGLYASVPKIYRARISQSGTAAPTVDRTYENTTGATPVYTRNDVGNYNLQMTGAFTANKTFIPSAFIKTTGDLVMFNVEYVDTDNVQITSYLIDLAGGTFTLSDDTILVQDFEILIYP